MRTVPTSPPSTGDARVTVVIAAYNGRRFILAAVESILAQSFKQFELLVADDGSTDGTLDALRSLSDARLRLLALPHAGLSSTLNRALEASAGEYVAFVGHDDISYNERLQHQVAFLDAHRDVAVVGAQYEAIDERGRMLGPYLEPLTHDEIVKAMRLEGNCIASPSMMARREAIEQVGGFRSIFDGAEDYDLLLRVSERWRLANLPLTLLQWRRLDTGMTLSQKPRQDALARAARECTRRRLAGLPEQAESCIMQALADSSANDSPQSRSAIWAASYLSWGVNYVTLGERRKAAKALVSSLVRRPLQPRAAAFLILTAFPPKTTARVRAFARRGNRA